MKSFRSVYVRIACSQIAVYISASSDVEDPRLPHRVTSAFRLDAAFGITRAAFYAISIMYSLGYFGVLVMRRALLIRIHNLVSYDIVLDFSFLSRSH